MAVRAGIDIGTNTILLLVAEVDPIRRLVTRILRDEVRVVRLGEGVDKHHEFQAEAMRRGERAFREYAEILAAYPGVDCRAAATSGSRDARNSPAYFQEMAEVLGHPIRVISGAEEAEVSFRGATSDRSDGERFAVIDIGGGSTEFIACEQNSGLLKHSFDVGCVRMAERFLRHDPATSSELTALRENVARVFQEKQDLFAGLRGRPLLAVAGTATYLASTALGLTRFDPDKVHGSNISFAQLLQLRKRLELVSTAERLGLGGMDQGRADVIVAGAIILEEAMLALGARQAEVSVRGLRYGLVL